MSYRQPRLHTLIISPGVSLLLMGVFGVLLMLGHWWQLASTVVIAALMTQQIKVLSLFRGRNYPFIGFFMLLQASLMPDRVGVIIGLLGLLALILILHSFLSPENTRTIFFIYLLCGLGALFHRSFALVALLLMACIILVRAFSARGLMAAFLGFITPAILVLPFDLQRVAFLKAIYTHWFVPGFSVPLIVVGAVAFLAVASTFLPSYGYPAQARARNMTIIGLTLGALVLAFADSTHAANYFALLNLGTAYCLTHLAAHSRHIWLPIAMVWLAFFFLYFYSSFPVG